MILLYAVSIASCERSVDISSSAGKNSMDRTYRDPHAGRYGANRLVAIACLSVLTRTSPTSATAASVQKRCSSCVVHGINF